MDKYDSRETIWNRYMVMGAIAGSFIMPGLGTLMGGYLGGKFGKDMVKFLHERGDDSRSDLERLQEWVEDLRAKQPPKVREAKREMRHQAVEPYQPKRPIASIAESKKPVVTAFTQPVKSAPAHSKPRHADYSSQTRMIGRDVMTHKLGGHELQIRKG